MQLVWGGGCAAAKACYLSGPLQPENGFCHSSFDVGRPNHSRKATDTEFSKFWCPQEDP